MKDLVYVTHPTDGEVEVLIEHHKNGLMIISAGAVGDVHMSKRDLHEIGALQEYTQLVIEKLNS